MNHVDVYDAGDPVAHLECREVTNISGNSSDSQLSEGYEAPQPQRLLIYQSSLEKGTLEADMLMDPTAGSTIQY